MEYLKYNKLAKKIWVRYVRYFFIVYFQLFN